MTATRARLAAAPAGLLRAVIDRYGLDLDGSSLPLAGGYENDLFLVGGTRGTFVVRVEARPPDIESVAWEHTLVRALATHVSEIVAPLSASDGTTFFRFGGQAVSVLPFVAGHAAVRQADRDVAASLLGRLHAVAADFDTGPRAGEPSLYERDWSLPDRLPAPLADARGRIERELMRCAGWLAATPLPRGPIHGDFYRGNILVDRGRVAGLVDWSEAHVDAFAYELANGVWEFCKVGDGYDRAGAQSFLTAYREAGGVVPAEHDVHLEPLIRCRRLVELLWAARQSPDAVDWDYQRHNLRSLERLG